MRVGPRCPAGGAAEAVAAGAAGMDVAVGEVGSKAVRTASVEGDDLADAAGVAFFADAVPFDGLPELREAVDLLFVPFVLDDAALLEDFVDDLDDGLLLLLPVEEVLPVLFDLEGVVCVLSVAARTAEGSAIQHAIVTRMATTRRTVRPRMGTPPANRTACAPVNASNRRIPLTNPCVAG